VGCPRASLRQNPGRHHTRAGPGSAALCVPWSGLQYDSGERYGQRRIIIVTNGTSTAISSATGAGTDGREQLADSAAVCSGCGWSPAQPKRFANWSLTHAGPVIGIGSPRASLESNFALRRLVGPENFYPGVCDTETQLLSSAVDSLCNGPVRSASLSDVASADAVLLLGEDVSNTAPVLELALRRSIFRRPSPKHSVSSPEHAPIRDRFRKTGPCSSRPRH
jgi:hypothetical protein